MRSKQIDLQVHKEIEEYCIVPYWNFLVHKSAPVARKRVCNSSCQTSIMLRMRDRNPTVDTRVGGQRARWSSSSSLSSCSTTSEWVDVADTNKYQPRHTCQFCKKEFSTSSAMVRHMKYNCLQNPGSNCNTSATHPFVCNECGRRFKVRKSLTYHQKHECQQTVVCPCCNKKYVGATVPARHIANCKRKQKLARKQMSTNVVSSGNDKDYSALILSTSDDNSD